MSKVDLDSIFGDKKEKTECPYCKKQFKIKLKIVFDDGKKIKCPSCRKDISEKLDKKTKDLLLGLDREIKDLTKTIKDLM